MNKFLIVIILAFNISFAQVGIGTSNPSSSSILELESTTRAFLPPRMTDSQMLTISDPLNGAIVFNTTFDALYVKTNVGWRNFFDISKPTLILNKEFTIGNNVLSTANNTYSNFPLNSSNIITNDATTFNVESDGKIRIKTAGIYLISSNLSVYNLPTGSRKYIIGVYKNGVLFNYLTRGEVNLNVSDEWGISGTISLNVAANDYIEIKYVLNNSGTMLDAKILNIGFTKLK